MFFWVFKKVPLFVLFGLAIRGRQVRNTKYKNNNHAVQIIYTFVFPIHSHRAFSYWVTSIYCRWGRQTTARHCEQLNHNQYLIVQSRQWNHQTNVWNLINYPFCRSESNNEILLERFGMTPDFRMITRFTLTNIFKKFREKANRIPLPRISHWTVEELKIFDLDVN